VDKAGFVGFKDCSTLFSLLLRVGDNRCLDEAGGLLFVVADNLCVKVVYETDRSVCLVDLFLY
jgi:hypothetical protein